MSESRGIVAVVRLRLAKSMKSIGTGRCLFNGRRERFGPVPLVLLGGVLSLSAQFAMSAAEWRAVCSSEGWEQVREDEDLEMTSGVGKSTTKNWKSSGKPVFDREAAPLRYAVLLGPKGFMHARCGITVVYIDGTRLKGNGDVKLSPGEHSIVFFYNHGDEVGTIFWEFKTVFEEGMEYRIQALVLDRFLKGPRWKPIMECRELQGYAPERTNGQW